MPAPIYSIVRRNMKHCSEGAFVATDEALSPLAAKLGIRPPENIVGAYRNPPPWNDTVIVFTSAALYLVEGEHSERLAIEDIIDYEIPDSKTDVTGVRILTKCGAKFVRIAGSFGPDGARKDAFSFIMVLQEVMRRQGP